jgi:membrane complex biogenesis BtpA family protein
MNILGMHKPVIGMLHVPALPGSPKNILPFTDIVRWVMRDAAALVSGGVDALMIENFGDVPFYRDRAPAHTATFLTTLGCAVKKDFASVPLGINVLRNDSITSLAVAAAVQAEFIRVNIHTGARLTDQGIIQGNASETLRYRKALSTDVKIFADVSVKHSAPLAPRPLEEDVADTIERGLADAIIVTGAATGKKTPLGDLKAAKAAAGAGAVISGSGVDAETIAEILKIADGVIVGTALKKDRQTTNAVDTDAVRQLLNAAQSVRSAGIE